MLMLRNRSIAVTSKQALIADQTSSVSPTKNPTKPISSFLSSPRFFNALLTKNLSDAEATLRSPTSILDTKNLSSFVNPFGYERNLLKSPTPCPEISSSCSKSKPEAVGLALIGLIGAGKNEGNFSKPINRMALYRSNLKAQILTINLESPKSPADFGIKTRNSRFLNPFPETPGPDFITRLLSLKEMELSEDYTCVITHGSNPRTTHIFGNCIVEKCCMEDAKISDDKNIEFGLETRVLAFGSADFPSFCHTCKRSLGQGKDIYIYGREKAFCSHECRCQEMLFDVMENREWVDAF